MKFNLVLTVLLVLVAYASIAAAGPHCYCLAVEQDPVCGVDGLTYSNPCFAYCSNVEVAYEGGCVVYPDGWGSNMLE